MAYYLKIIDLKKYFKNLKHVKLLLNCKNWNCNNFLVLFKMSQLSCNRDTPPESEKNATAKIVSILEYQEDLSVVYTHHPGLLYWAFTSNISRNIQFKIVWLYSLFSPKIQIK